MKLIHYELAKILIEYPVVQKTFISKPAFKRSLSECKKKIISSYISTVSDSTVHVAYVMQSLTMNPTVDRIHNFIKDLSESFQKYFAYNEGSNSQVSPIYHLFHKFRERFEIESFTKLQNQLEDQFVRGNLESAIPMIYKRFIISWYTFIELSVLFLSGLHLDCKNFRPEVFSMDTFSIYPGDVIKAPHGDCDLQEYVKQAGEFIHLFILDEFRFKTYIESMMIALLNTHKDPGSISIIIDYKLHKPFVYDKDSYEVYAAAESAFGEITCINCEHVDFGAYKDKVSVKSKTFGQAASELIDGEGFSSNRKKAPLIGELLVKHSRITQEELQKALQIQRTRDDGTLLGTILKEEFNITDEEIIQVLEQQESEF